MSLSPGTRLGPYEILSPLGAGGMGEVYRARDSRLEREVAIKVLPAGFSRTTRSGSRGSSGRPGCSPRSTIPRIAAIYGLEESSGTRFLVLELVEGESLAERVAPARSRSTRRSPSAARSPRRSKPRTRRASSTGT